MMFSIKNLWAHSIQRQLIIGIALVHAVLMTIFVFDLVSREQEFLIELSKEQAISLAETLAVNGSSWVLANDFVGMEEVIQSQSEFPSLRYAMFANTQGKVLGFTDRKKVGMYFQDSISNALLTKELDTHILVNNTQEIDVAAPIFSGDTHIGWARVGISRKSILKNIEMVSKKGIYFTLLAITVGVLFAWLMARSLTQGINTLLVGAKRIEAGDENVNFKLNRQDELGHLGRALAITTEKLAKNELKLKIQAERTRVTLRSIGDGVITTFADGTIEYFNPVAENLTGWSSEEVKGKHLDEVFNISSELTGKEMDNPVEKVLKENIIIGLANHTMLTHRDGSKISIEDSAAPIHNDNGEITGVVLVFHDATDERKLQEEMAHQATHDVLTGIYNRTAFEKQLHDLQVDSRKLDNCHALLYIDLDQFKLVNDTSGHIAGDELLKQIATEFDQVIRGSDMLARIGGDEFAVLLQNCDKEHALAVAENVRKMTQAYKFIWDSTRHQIGVSIGISMITNTSQLSEVMSQADLACYKAKSDGRNCIHLYTPNDDELSQSIGEMHWVTKIHDALEKKQFILYSQKIKVINTDENTDFVDIDYREVLVRLKNDAGEIISPNSFIPAAERYGLMAKIDQFIISTACEWLALQPKGCVKLSINLSGQSLGNKAFLDFIETKLKQNPKAAKYIVFEITETAAISNLRVAIRFMQRLINLGIKFSLDDFGSGLSSFAYLKNMPVSFIKIDGNFVRDMATDSVDAAMVQAIVDVGNKLGMQTIAEFVENEETFTLLKQYGVNYVQGYHIEKPKRLV